MISSIGDCHVRKGWTRFQVQVESRNWLIFHFAGLLSGLLDKPTSFPILFASNTLDPVTPLKSYGSPKSDTNSSMLKLLMEINSHRAHKMSSRFAGSVVILQDAVGVSLCSHAGVDYKLPESRLTLETFALEYSIQLLTRVGQIVILDISRDTLKA